MQRAPCRVPRQRIARPCAMHVQLRRRRLRLRRQMMAVSRLGALSWESACLLLHGFYFYSKQLAKVHVQTMPCVARLVAFHPSNRLLPNQSPPCPRAASPPLHLL